MLREARAPGPRYLLGDPYYVASTPSRKRSEHGRARRRLGRCGLPRSWELLRRRCTTQLGCLTREIPGGELLRLPAARLAGSLSFGPSYLTRKDALKHRDTDDYPKLVITNAFADLRAMPLALQQASNYYHWRHGESSVAPCSFRGAVRDFDLPASSPRACATTSLAKRNH